LNESLFDCAGIGTGCIAFIDEPGKNLDFMAIPINQIFFLENYYGYVDVVFRQHVYTTRQIEQRWGEEALPKSVDRTNPNAKHTLIEGVVPEGDKFRYVTFLEKGFNVLENKLQKYNPFIVFRWEKTLSEIWGESPLRKALPNIKTVNRMVRSILAHGEFAALGAWQSNDEAFNTRQAQNTLIPGTILYSEGDIRPISFPGQFDITQPLLESERANIRNNLHDVGLTPNPTQNTYMTATEVAARREEFFKRVGQPALRLQKELLQVLAQQALRRLVDRGDLPPPAPEIVQVAQQLGFPVQKFTDVFKVEVTATISKAMKLIDANNNINAYAQMMQVAPEATPMLVNQDEFIRRTLRGMGFANELVKSAEQVAQERQQMAEMAKQVAPEEGELIDQAAQMPS